MTPRQFEALMYLNRYMRISRGVSPTYREIAAGIGLANQSGVHRIMASLKDQGFVDWTMGKHRCLRVVRMPEPAEVPPSEVSELRKRVEELERQMTDILAPNVVPMRGRVR